MSDYLTISIYEDGVFAGRGIIRTTGTSGQAYVDDCPAVLGDDVYDAIADELTEVGLTDSGIRVNGHHYTWTVSDTADCA